MKKNFDPLQYIESAFLDRTVEADKDLPSIKKYVSGQVKLPRGKFRKTEMSAPRPRRKSNHVVSNAVDPELQKVWANLPKSVMFLASLYDDNVTSHYYTGEYKPADSDDSCSAMSSLSSKNMAASPKHNDFLGWHW